MSREWRQVRLGDVIELQRGFDITASERVPGPFQVVASSGIVGAHSKAKVKGPGVVTGRYGTIGQVFYIEKDFWPTNTTLFVKDFKGNDPLFVSYLLRTIDWESFSDKSSVPGVNRNHVHLLTVEIPSVAEQRTIAHILGTLDDKIELNRRMNETLEAMACAIFKSWFVDFDPVRARTEGRQPAGTDAETAVLFPDAFEDSPLGKIPKGWRVSALPEVIEVNPHRSLPKRQSAPYLDMQNMPTRGHRPAEWINRPLGSGTKFINGDTLLARITPCLENGKTAFVDFLEDGQVGWGSTEYIVLRPKSPLPPEFGYYLARSEDLRTYAIQNMTGSSGRQRVPAECFKSFRIVVPTEGVARRFGETAGSLMEVIKQKDEESHTLAVIRDAVLPKLLSGEIRLNNVERSEERVAVCVLPNPI